MADTQPRVPRLEHLRQQRQMIILYEHYSSFSRCFFQNSLRKDLVDPSIRIPVRVAIYRPFEDVVTKRPQRLVGQSFVVRMLQCRGYPQSPERERWTLGRY